MKIARRGTPTSASRSSLRSIPSVEKVLQGLESCDLPRASVLYVVRRELARLRARQDPPPEFPALLSTVRERIAKMRRARLQTVINGTGVLIHTNLGRAPLAPSAVEAMRAVASGYCNLELDLDSGQRGGRGGYVEQALALLCGAGATTVVNNCAGALVLILKHLTGGDRKEVVISRGELVQIGGGFRIPEILETSGANLREVGTTNRTALGDYARAMGSTTALVLKVHRSNFFMEGFVESPSTADLAGLARRKGVPLVEDLGSGAVLDTAQWTGLGHEPTPQEVLRAGADLVCFSGDKLFGGPQAGIIAGRPRLLAALKQEPFFRALRCDKLVLSALQATVDLHLNQQKSLRQIPTMGGLPLFDCLRVPEEVLRRRAQTLLAGLESLPIRASLVLSQAQVGGGTLPKAILPSVAVDLQPRGLSLTGLARGLRQGCPPVIGTLVGNRFRVDLRTVLPEQDGALAAALRQALSASV
jgi:L-seryl-tRNA(Ser) seleniumtransferase